MQAWKIGNKNNNKQVMYQIHFNNLIYFFFGSILSFDHTTCYTNLNNTY